MVPHPHPSGSPAPPEGAPLLRVVRVSEQAAVAAEDRLLLSVEERARADAFVRPQDRDRYLVAHTVLRRELAGRLGVRPAAVRFVRAPCPVCGGPHGRPSLPGHPLHFSLSHAGDLVVLAFAGTPVGVDVEMYPEPGTVAEVSAVLHPRERAELAGLPESGRPAAFARCWTRKEAYLKGTGAGLGEDPAVSYVGTLPEPPALRGWQLADISVLPGYAAASALRLTRTGDAATP